MKQLPSALLLISIIILLSAAYLFMRENPGINPEEAAAPKQAPAKIFNSPKDPPSADTQTPALSQKQYSSNVLSQQEAEIEIARLANEIIAAEPDSEALEQLIKSFIATTDHLESSTQVEAITLLNAITATHNDPLDLTAEAEPLDYNNVYDTQPAPGDITAIQSSLQSLRQQISNTPEVELQSQLLVQYFTLAESLPENQQLDAIMELNQYLVKPEDPEDKAP